MLVYHYTCLDIPHLGHFQMIANCRAVAGTDGLLIVGVLTDEAIAEKKPPPLLSFDERFRIAQNIKGIDLAVAQTTYSPIPNVLQMRPDVLMESTSHTPEAIEEGRRVMATLGGKVIVVPYYPGVSSSVLKTRA